jgi:predicted dehydrogenase
MNSIRFGLIGAGGIAEYTAREIASHPEARITAVADPSAERAEALARRFGADSVPDAQRLLDRDDIDAVYIAVPNRLHAPLAQQALAAGKHVLLEKPFALTAVEADATIAASVDAGKTLMLGMNQRFDPAVQRARAQVARGMLGPVYHARAWWRRRAGIPRIGSWFTDRNQAGGGALLDIGVHVLDATLHILGNFRAVSVSGATFTRFGNRGLGDGHWGRSERASERFDVDDFATAMIRMDDGTVIQLEAAWALHQPSEDERAIELAGEQAGLSVFTGRLYQVQSGQRFVTTEGADDGPLAFPHCSRAHHFVNVLMGREAPNVDLSEALAVQRILDAIYHSAATGRDVRLVAD